MLRAGALGSPRGMGWGRRLEGGSGWGTHVHPWLIHVDVWQNHYNIIVVFAIHSHESAMGVHVFLILNTPPPAPSHPLGLSQCTSPECPVSCIKPGLVIYSTYGNILVSMLFSQIIPPSPFPTESKSLFFISVSLLLPRI